MHSAVSDYRVQLDVFTGPLDLLLYLIRREEIDIHEIPIARITEPYLQYVRVLEQVDPNAAGDFLVMASTLLEIKSRCLLPSPPPEPPDADDSPQAVLVRQLLEYKRIKDAAAALERAADERARRFARRPAALPPELAGVELEDVELWDLVEAFGKVMASIGARPGVHEVRLAETPIEVYVERILTRLEPQGHCTFEALFEGRQTRATVVGILLALLELIRERRVSARQEKLFGTIHIFLLEDAPASAADPTAETPVGAVEDQCGVAGPARRTSAPPHGQVPPGGGQSVQEASDEQAE